MNASAIIALISLIIQATEADLPAFLAIIKAIEQASAPHQAVVASALLSIVKPAGLQVPANAPGNPFKA